MHAWCHNRSNLPLTLQCMWTSQHFFPYNTEVRITPTGTSRQCTMPIHAAIHFMHIGIQVFPWQSLCTIVYGV